MRHRPIKIATPAEMIVPFRLSRSMKSQPGVSPPPPPIFPVEGLAGGIGVYSSATCAAVFGKGINRMQNRNIQMRRMVVNSGGLKNPDESTKIGVEFKKQRTSKGGA